MTSLMNTISSRLSQADDPNAPTVGQKQIADILKTKSGRAGAAGGPAASGLQAASAEQQTQMAQRQQQFAGAAAGGQLQEQARAQAAQTGLAEIGLKSTGKLGMAQIQAAEQQATNQRIAAEEMARSKRTAGENMKMDAMQGAATNALRELETSRHVAMDNIFGQFQADNKMLANRRDAADLEQIGFTLAMSDRAYIDEMNRVGRERQLHNEQNFDIEMRNIVFGDNLAAVMDEMNFSTDFNAKQREWEQELENMGAQQARSFARAIIKDQQTAQMISGLGGIASQGASAYAESTVPTPEKGKVQS